MRHLPPADRVAPPRSSRSERSDGFSIQGRCFVGLARGLRPRTSLLKEGTQLGVFAAEPVFPLGTHQAAVGRGCRRECMTRCAHSAPVVAALSVLVVESPSKANKIQHWLSDQYKASNRTLLESTSSTFAAGVQQDPSTPAGVTVAYTALSRQSS